MNDMNAFVDDGVYERNSSKIGSIHNLCLDKVRDKFPILYLKCVILQFLLK